jgi:hypothetical protein
MIVRRRTRYARFPLNDDVLVRWLAYATTAVLYGACVARCAAQ